MQALDNVQALQCATVPYMDRRSVTDLAGRNDASVTMGYRTADDLLLVVDVVTLLADGRIEKHDDASDEEDDLLIYHSCLPFVFVHGACAQGRLPANCVLQTTAYIASPDAVDPFKLCFEILGSFGVVVNSLRLKTVGDQRLQCCVQPASEVEGPPIQRQLTCVSGLELHYIERKLFVLVLQRLLQVLLIYDEFVLLQSLR